MRIQKDQPIISWLPSNSKMGTMVKHFNWSETAVGPLEQWPQSLQTAAGICLNSSFPMLIWWGPDLIQIYNDAYRPIAGGKHPQSLGQPGAECWSEVWEVLGPLANQVVTQGLSTWDEDLLLIMNRHGYDEETYFTFSYSPIPGEGGGIGGVLVTCVETTDRVLGERRLQTLKKLSEIKVNTKQIEENWKSALAELAKSRFDIPAALLYLLDDTGKEAHLYGDFGLLEQNNPFPETIHRDDGECINHLIPDLETVFIGKPLGPIPISSELISNSPAGSPWRTSLFNYLILPIGRPGDAPSYGFLITFVSPMLALDAAYRTFLDLAMQEIAACISNAYSFIQERQRAEALIELDRAKTLFFNNVSHEFRTPLTLMLGPIENLLKEDLDADLRTHLNFVHRAARRLQKLVNNLLDFSRIEANRFQARYKMTNLSLLTTDLASTFRSLIEHAGLRFEVNCPPLPRPVSIDQDMWERIVFNLLSNAFKFTLAGEIKVSLKAEGETVSFSVSDSGVGIPLSEQKHLFERFHRVEHSRGRSQEGTGIGLALVSEMVKLHGGTIAVESELDKGSTFTVTLPFEREGISGEDSEQTLPLSYPIVSAETYLDEASGWLPEAVLFDQNQNWDSLVNDQDDLREKVLVADDNSDMRTYLYHLLAPYYNVAMAEDGQTALHKALQLQPDLILSDVMMPQLDGFELIEAIRQEVQTRTIPVILLSARAGEEAHIDGLEAGADDYLVKPFNARELLASVRAHLEMGRVRREAEQAERKARTAVEEARDELEIRVKKRTEQVRSLASRLTFAEQVERRRIAQLIHDELQQQLLVMQFSLNDLSDKAEVTRNETIEALNNQILETIGIARRIATELNPVVYSSDYLEDVLSTVAEQFQQRYGLQISVSGTSKVPNQSMRHFISNLVRELLTNIIKYAQTDKAWIEIDEAEDQLELHIIDKGAGFNTLILKEVSQATGLGLTGMDERVRLFGGDVRVDSQPGKGARVTIELPKSSLNSAKQSR